MIATAYHARLFVYDLTHRSAEDDTCRLSSALSNAQVDLNLHQIEAAQFTLCNPARYVDMDQTAHGDPEQPHGRVDGN